MASKLNFLLLALATTLFFQSALAVEANPPAPAENISVKKNESGELKAPVGNAKEGSKPSEIQTAPAQDDDKDFFIGNEEVSKDQAFVKYAVEATSFAPMFLGVGPAVKFGDRFSFFGSYGNMPKEYSKLLGSLVDAVSNTKGYSQLAQDVFQQNEAYLLGAKLHFGSTRQWNWTIYYHHMNFSGTSLLTTIGTATGEDYTGISTILVAAGKNPAAFASGTIQMMATAIGYDFHLTDHLFLTTSFGVMKIYAADLKMSTALPALDNSVNGKKQLAQLESDTANTLKMYGYSPLIGTHLSWNF